ncbi:MAG: Pr6Pr family membrane protein [Gemmobacter sp.]|jgi:hypothetical protein|nr:Pr6Pr family membrane protein [Gemmobacter sp.]
MTRPVALILGLLAMAALVAEFHRLGLRPQAQDWAPRLWAMGRYFTILTNALVAGVMLAVAAGRRVPPDVVMTAVLNILMVGVVYQVLLRPSVPFQGLRFWTDLALHALVPAGAVLWWLGWGPRGLTAARIPRWLLWPLAYCGYALWRGASEGRYPYFFVDVGRFGWGQVGLNIAGLVLVFGGVGWALAALSRRLR